MCHENFWLYYDAKQISSSHNGNFRLNYNSKHRVRGVLETSEQAMTQNIRTQVVNKTSGYVMFQSSVTCDVKKTFGVLTTLGNATHASSTDASTC